ncbi:DUF1349 domain-containing protein [Streptomyces sp. NPDC004457]|uniref:DUF1349 domain-containing protein n=1 Tax=Streptomyces spinosus TaxID=2872623 RepID=UPI001CECE49A|nr:DUF1349 domain-containing protein [Streptomyces spinosus]
MTATVRDFDDSWSLPGDRASARLRPDGALEVTAPAGSDLYRMPGIREVDGVPEVSRLVEGDFTLTVRVSVHGAAGGARFSDAGGLLVHTADGWAKICVEPSPQGRWGLVTVVSRPDSDEARGPDLAGPAAELVLVREGTRLAFLDRVKETGETRFVRTLTVPPGPLRVSLFAQAPFSEHCTAVFDHLNITPEALRDRR